MHYFLPERNVQQMNKGHIQFHVQFGTHSNEKNSSEINFVTHGMNLFILSLQRLFFKCYIIQTLSNSISVTLCSVII